MRCGGAARSRSCLFGHSRVEPSAGTPGSKTPRLWIVGLGFSGNFVKGNVDRSFLVTQQIHSYRLCLSCHGKPVARLAPAASGLRCSSTYVKQVRRQRLAAA